MNVVIEKFVELEGGDDSQISILNALWGEKVTKLKLSDFQTLEAIEGNTLSLKIFRGNIVAIIHKPTKLFLLVYGLSALELESLRYIVLKSKNPNDDFVSLVYEYLNKGNARLGLD